MWQTILKYLGAELIKHLASWIQDKFGEWAAIRRSKKTAKVKEEINEALKNRDARELASKLDKL
jgi:hypothetical protein